MAFPTGTPPKKTGIHLETNWLIKKSKQIITTYLRRLVTLNGGEK